jgi:hypothetical protein
MAYLYGFINMKDLYARRVTEVGVDEVNVAIERSPSPSTTGRWTR